MEKVGEEEVVLGAFEEGSAADESRETTRSGLHVKVSPEEAAGLDFFLISRRRLEDLASEAYNQCSTCGVAVTPTVTTASGTAAHVSWICPQNHSKHICTQEVVDRSHVGDIRIASALLLSGNNFDKVALMARFGKLNFFSRGTYYKLQENYMIPAISQCWENMRQENITRHSSSPIVVCGDARNDSPGHCAQYATYTFMENETHDVLHVGFVDKRETAMRSPNMEMKAFKEGLASMEDSGLAVKEVVTDAHSSIAKYMNAPWQQMADGTQGQQIDRLQG